MPTDVGLGVHVNLFPLFAKLTKLRSPFAKLLDGCFLHFFANTKMQSPYAKRLGMLLLRE
jgi:hypothetical protein